MTNNLSQMVADWRCKRCGEDVDMGAFRCGCSDGPSPWEPAASSEDVLTIAQSALRTARFALLRQVDMAKADAEIGRAIWHIGCAIRNEAFRTSPPADDVVEAVARGVDFSGVFTEARFRFVNDATQPIDFNEHLVRVAAEHAARAAISAMPRTSPELVEAARRAAARFRIIGTLPHRSAAYRRRNREIAEMLEAALRNAEQPEPRTSEGWQDISSAPKDGTKFDAWVPDAFGGHRMTDLSFNARGQLRQHGLLTPAELPRWPTHWRPLPPAPEPQP